MQYGTGIGRAMARRGTTTSGLLPLGLIEAPPSRATSAPGADAAGQPAGDPRADATAVTDPAEVRGHRARMPLQVEPHGLVSHARRFAPDDPGQFAFELRYPTEHGTASWRVTADNDSVVIVGGADDTLGTVKRLPGPLTHDLMVVVGEDANARTRGRRWNVDSDAERTFEWSMTELLGRVRQIPGGQTRQSLRETLIRLARLRVVASGGAGRAGRRRTKTTVVTGLFDRLEITEEPGETRVRLTISRALAQQLAEDFRLLETTRYWQLESGPARRLYRLLDWACYTHPVRGTDALRVPVHFLRDRLPIDEQKTHQIVRKLDALHADLVAAGFLAALPTYAETTAADLRRFPTYPGKRARLSSALYRFAPDAIPSGKPAAGVTGDAPPLRGEHRALLTSLGVPLLGDVAVPDGRSDLHARVLEAQQLCGDRGNVGLYTALCKALPEEAYRRVVATVRADRPEVPRAAFVRMAKDELRRHGLEVPAAATDRRLLAALLQNPT